MGGAEGGEAVVSGLIGKLRTEIHGSEEHARELEGELAASHAHRAALEARVAALEAAAKHVAHHAVVPRHGVDYAAHRTILPSTVGELRRAGVTFTGRYLPEPGTDKGLTLAEARMLSAGGIDLVAIFETDGQTTGGYERGVADAHLAAKWAHGLVPAGRPIYFTADREGLVDEAAEYARGAVSVLGFHAVGMYGDFDVVEHLHGLHRCAYLYQTLAWSRGRWSNHAQLRQYENGRIVAGIEVDLDEARAADFGQWRV